MKAYIGTKIIQAEPAKHPETGEDGYVVMYPDGYTSWSPKYTFEAAYREISFSERQMIDIVEAATAAGIPMETDEDLAAAIDLASDDSTEEEPEPEEPEHKHYLGPYDVDRDGRPCRAEGCDYLE